VIVDEIPLPCVVVADKKKAYFFHGTVYVTLEKMDVPHVPVTANDWLKAPAF
jgi:hypothetical protein